MGDASEMFAREFAGLANPRDELGFVEFVAVRA